MIVQKLKIAAEIWLHIWKLETKAIKETWFIKWIGNIFICNLVIERRLRRSAILGVHDAGSIAAIYASVTTI